MKTRAVILAGGEGSRLGVLTDKRAKPAVPFAGKYRIIEHIGAGRPWDLDRGFTGGVQIYQPYRGRMVTDWYKGTADAISQNLSFVERGLPDIVLVLSGDHIYKMNYDPLIRFHLERKADVTIATLNVTRDEATRMGILATDPADVGRIINFVEKPADPPGTLASMGIYVFGRATLSQVLTEDNRRRDSSHDFGKDVIPRMVASGQKAYAYPFEGYWVDVGTIEAYWESQMDLLEDPPPLDLNDRTWIVHTRSEERPPVVTREGASIKDSMVTDGCVISPGAQIERSVLSPGVYIGPKAIVRESVVLTDARIEAGARVERAVIDKLVRIGKGARVGHIEKSGVGLGITTVGKNALIRDKIVVARGAVVEADSVPD